MRLNTSISHLRQEGLEDRRHYQMQVTDTPMPVLTRLLGQHDNDLLTGRPPILAKPLQPGAAQIYAQRFCTAQSNYDMLIFKGFGLSVLSAVTATGVCMAVGPLLGATAVVINGAACVVIPMVFAGAVIRERLALCGQGAAMLIAQASEEMDHVPSSLAMARHYAERGQEVVASAHVLGVTDERLLPAVRHYVERYNDKFGDDFEVI